MLVHTVKNTKQDTFTTVSGGKGTHGTDAAAHLDEEALDDVGGTEPLPMSFGTDKEGQQFFQIPFQAGDSLGCLALPVSFPVTEATDGFGPVLGLIDELGLRQARLLGRFEFIFQVAQLVRPATLMRHGGPEPAQGFDQTGLTIGGHQFQKLSVQSSTPQVP